MKEYRNAVKAVWAITEAVWLVCHRHHLVIISIIKSRWVDGEMIVRDGREEEGWRELEGILDKK